jgi:transposase InsO family protein
VSPAWFYKWRHGDPSPRHARRIAVAAEVARLLAAHHGRYGSPRITADLREAGWRVSENTVAQLMREQRLVARAKKRRRGRRHPRRPLAPQRALRCAIHSRGRGNPLKP